MVALSIERCNARLLLLAILTLGLFIAQEASPIKHVVILTLENRSFDHLLGWLKTADVASSSTCLPLNVSNPSAGSACVSSGAKYFVASEDPNHEFDGVTEQIFGGTTAPYTAQVRCEGNLWSHCPSGGTPMLAIANRQAQEPSPGRHPRGSHLLPPMAVSGMATTVATRVCITSC